MSKRVCAEPGCPTLIDAGASRCTTHARAKDRARGTSGQRGYGYQHQLDRETWRPAVERGVVPCRRCRQLIPVDAPWDLGHPDADCPRPKAPEHEACNRGTAGR